MNCEHNLIFTETENKYPFFACIECLKAEPAAVLKNFKCTCEGVDSKCWKLSLTGGRTVIYCEKTRRIIHN